MPALESLARRASAVRRALFLASLALAAAACVHPRAVSPDIYDWESRFPPAAACMARVAPGGPIAGASDDSGQLVVRVTIFDSAEPLLGSVVTLSPLDAPDRVAAGVRSDTSTLPPLPRVPAGRYVMAVRRIGVSSRVDTVTVRAGALDTIHVAVDQYIDEFANVHNCRPRGFRRAGESACVTDSEESYDVLEGARRSFVSPRGRRTYRLPPGDSTAVLIRDERVCERAGREYGGPESPPRRVVVIAAGNLYIVYDPYEPERAGEWSITKVFDDSWRFLTGLAG